MSIRLTFTGDLLLYSSQIRKSKTFKGYSFDHIFNDIKYLFEDSDYVVGNLETPLAGRKAKYTKMDMLFNSPDEFAIDAKKAGFSMFTTANNHCLDKGVDGLKRTIKILDENGIDHTGTFLYENDKRYLIKEIKGVKFAFISYTYGTNPNVNGVEVNANNEYVVNITKHPEGIYRRPFFKQLILNGFYHLPLSLQNVIHPLYPKQRFNDCVDSKEIINPENTVYLDKMKQIILDAKDEADIVVFCLHSGGQFNNEIGDYTNFLIKEIKKMAVDILIVNHPHCVLGSKWNTDNTFEAYSLGNFCFTPHEGYYIDDVYGDYGIVLNIDFDSVTKKIKDVSFAIVKSIVMDNGKSKTIPLNFSIMKSNIQNYMLLIEKDSYAVIKRFVNKQHIDISTEVNCCGLFKYN